MENVLLGDLPVIARLQQTNNNNNNNSNNNVIPLISLGVVITVQHYVAQVEIVLKFVNQESNPIEAEYVLRIKIIKIIKKIKFFNKFLLGLYSNKRTLIFMSFMQ